jgi:hypothetical protein
MAVNAVRAPLGGATPWVFTIFSSARPPDVAVKSYRASLGEPPPGASAVFSDRTSSGHDGKSDMRRCESPPTCATTDALTRRDV